MGLSTPRSSFSPPPSHDGIQARPSRVRRFRWGHSIFSRVECHGVFFKSPSFFREY